MISATDLNDLLEILAVSADNTANKMKELERHGAQFDGPNALKGFAHALRREDMPYEIIDLLSSRGRVIQ